MKKRLIALLLAVVMAFGFAVPALADAVLDSDFYVQDPNGSTAYQSYNKDAKGAGWSWSASARTMTLSGIDLRDKGMCWGIAFENPPYDIKVVVKDGTTNYCNITLIDYYQNKNRTLTLTGKGTIYGNVGNMTSSLKIDGPRVVVDGGLGVLRLNMRSGSLSARCLTVYANRADALTVTGGAVSLDRADLDSWYKTLQFGGYANTDFTPDTSGYDIKDGSGSKVELIKETYSNGNVRYYSEAAKITITAKGSSTEPDPSPSPSQEPEPSPSPSPSQEPEPSPSPSQEPEPSPSPSQEPEPSPSPSPSQEPEPSPSPSPSQEPEPSPSPSQEPEPSPEPKPEDIPSEWAAEEVAAAIEAGLVPEKLQHNYREGVTRGQVAEMFVNLIELVAEKPALQVLVDEGATIKYGVFDDTNDIDVLIANALGIIKGTTPTTFKPDSPLTRCQITAILKRTADIFDVETEGYTHPFTDVENHWCEPELGWPYYAGIIKGTTPTTFTPDRPMKTEEAIAITYRAYLALKDISAE